RSSGARAEGGRIVAVVNVFDADHRLRTARARIVTRPLAEGSFGFSVRRIHPALDDDFRVGGERKPGGFSFDHFDRLAFQSPGVIEFRNAVVDLVSRDHEEHRILADGDNHRAGFAALEVLVALNAAVLARRNVQSHAVLVMYHAAVSAEVYPTFVRVTRRDQTGGTDKAAAVELMHERNGKFEQVDLVTRVDVFQNRTFADDFVFDRFVGDELLAKRTHQVQTGKVHVEAKIQRHPFE